MNTHLQTARQARRAMDQVRKQLLMPAPDAIAACAAPFLTAVRCLESLQLQLKQNGSGRNEGAVNGDWGPLGEEILQLRRDLLQVSALLEGAARFWEGWGRLLASDSGEATVEYSPVPRSREVAGSRFIVHG